MVVQLLVLVVVLVLLGLSVRTRRGIDNGLTETLKSLFFPCSSPCLSTGLVWYAGSGRSGGSDGVVMMAMTEEDG